MSEERICSFVMQVKKTHVRLTWLNYTALMAKLDVSVRQVSYLC
jgi:hypothetical protein